jgi:hypothetical protein
MFKIPRFEVPKIENLKLEIVDLTVAQVKAMSDEELLKLLSGESDLDGIIPQPLQQLITSELLARGLAKASKPHWSVVPSFWMLIATVLLTLVGAVAAILALPQAQKMIQPSRTASTPASLAAKSPQTSRTPEKRR